MAEVSLDKSDITLVRKSEDYVSEVVSGDFNAQVREFTLSEACSCGRCTFPAQRIDNRERLLQF